MIMAHVPRSIVCEVRTYQARRLAQVVDGQVWRELLGCLGRDLL
jgi:hypothetical protein